MGLAHARSLSLVSHLERSGALALCPEHAKSLVRSFISGQHSRHFGNHLSSWFQKIKDELVCLITANKKPPEGGFLLNYLLLNRCDR